MDTTGTKQRKYFNPSLEFGELCGHLFLDRLIKKRIYSDKNDNCIFNRDSSVSLPDLKSSVILYPPNEYCAFPLCYLNGCFNLSRYEVLFRRKTFTSLPNIYLNEHFDCKTKTKSYFDASELNKNNHVSKKYLENWVLIRLGNGSGENSLVKMLISKLQVERCVASEKEILLCELQKSYEKLLIKYAEAENTIDRMKLGFAQPVVPQEHDVAELKLRAISYGNNYEIEETNEDKVNCRTNDTTHKSNSSLITKNNLGPNAMHITPLDLFSNEDILSSIDSLSTSFTQKSIKLADISLDVSGREIFSSMNCNGNLLKEENGDFFKMIGHQNMLLNEKENKGIQLPVIPCPKENAEMKHHLESIEKTSQDNPHVEGKVHLNNSYIGDGFKVKNGRRNLSHFQIRETNSCKKYYNTDNSKLTSSNLCLESVYGKEESTLIAENHHKREPPSSFSYALVWPIHFETKGDENPVDRSLLETCSGLECPSHPSSLEERKSSGNFSSEFCVSLSSLERTPSDTLAEEVLVDTTPKINCSGIETSLAKDINKSAVRNNIVKMNSKCHGLTELLNSIDRADKLASKMKKKSENLKSFLASRLKNIS